MSSSTLNDIPSTTTDTVDHLSTTHRETNTQPSAPDNPPPPLSVVNSSSLLFGFVFLAILITVMGSGCLWQRYMRARRGGVGGVGMGVGANGSRDGSIGGEREKPALWDVYLGRQGEVVVEEVDDMKGKGRSEAWRGGGSLNMHDGTWTGMKPLSIQLLSPLLDDLTDDSATAIRHHPMPLWQATIRGWLYPTDHTHDRTHATSTSRHRSGLSSILPTRWRRRRVAQRPAFASPAHPHEKHEASSHIEMLSSTAAPPPVKTKIQVAVVIAMPSPSRPLASSMAITNAHSSLGSTVVPYDSNTSSIDPSAITTTARPLRRTSNFSLKPSKSPEELVYELGITEASVYADPRLCGFGIEDAAEDKTDAKAGGGDGGTP